MCAAKPERRAIFAWIVALMNWFAPPTHQL